jgi:TonB family protein
MRPDPANRLPLRGCFTFVFRRIPALSGLLAMLALPLAMFAQSPARHAWGDAQRSQPEHFVVVSLEHPFLDSANDPSTATVEKSGTLPTTEGRRLRLSTELGNIHIFTDSSGEVAYRVVGEAEPLDSRSQQFLSEFVLTPRPTSSGISLDGQMPHRTFRGRFQFTIEVHVPNRYNVESDTAAGNIDVQSIQGYLILTTGGGNISVGNVAGNLRVTTSGGHITAGDIEGDGILHTGGGHIRAGRIKGLADLDTDGGNIHVQRVGSAVKASTSGGQIVIAESSGEIHARTDGGSVHLERVSLPTNLETDGNVFLRNINAPLRASSAYGNITAWLDRDDRAAGRISAKPAHKTGQGESQLTSGGGNIVLYVPRERGVTLDAVGNHDSGQQISADSSEPLLVSYQDSQTALHTLRCPCNLNGGGERMKLKAAAGNIVLRTSDPAIAAPAEWILEGPEGLSAARSQQMDTEDGSSGFGFIEEMFRRVEESFWGGVPINPDELQKHLQHSMAPIYPRVARTAGVEGDVILRVYVSSEGRVSQLKVLAGAPLLARAAVEALRQWRYVPFTMNGHLTNVVTTLVVEFRLQ